MTERPSHIEAMTRLASTRRGQEIDAIMRGVAEVLTPVLEAVEVRLAALEARPGLKYRGVWNHGAYAPGDLVTHKGSLWHCEQPTHAAPGDGSEAWRLAVKRGRDARGDK